MIKKKKEERKRYFISERKLRWIAPASNPTLRFMFNIGVIKDNFCEAMVDLRKLL